MIEAALRESGGGCQGPQARQSSWVFQVLPWTRRSGRSRSTRIASNLQISTDHLKNPPDTFQGSPTRYEPFKISENRKFPKSSKFIHR
jgi:hypothetical protein